MRRSSLFSAALAAFAAVLVAGCSTTSPAFRSTDRTITSSIAPRASQQDAKQRYQGMVTNGRTGYIVRRVEPKPMF